MTDCGVRWSPETVDRSIILARMQTMLSELASGRERFAACGKTRGSALNEACRGLLEKDITHPVALFLERTINFLALTDTLVPQRIQGGIGRVGARLPDLTINRRVQDDMRSLITEKVLPALSPVERMRPKSVINVIRGVVGAWLGVAELPGSAIPGTP